MANLNFTGTLKQNSVLYNGKSIPLVLGNEVAYSTLEDTSGRVPLLVMGTSIISQLDFVEGQVSALGTRVSNLESSQPPTNPDGTVDLGPLTLRVADLEANNLTFGSYIQLLNSKPHVETLETYVNGTKYTSIASSDKKTLTLDLGSFTTPTELTTEVNKVIDSKLVDTKTRLEEAIEDVELSKIEVLQYKNSLDYTLGLILDAINTATLDGSTIDANTIINLASLLNNLDNKVVLLEDRVDTQIKLVANEAAYEQLIENNLIDQNTLYLIPLE